MHARTQFGTIMEIRAHANIKRRGQAFVTFEDVEAASAALRSLQGFPFFDKPMKIAFAKTKADVIAKRDGTYVPRNRRDGKAPGRYLILFFFFSLSFVSLSCP